MEKILRRIVAFGRKEINGHQCISELLFNVLTNYQEFAGFEKLQVNERQFIKVDSIPDDILGNLGLFRQIPSFSTESFDRKFKKEYGADFSSLPPLDPESFKQKEGHLAEWDIDHAVAKAKSYEHEFIDHFIGATEIGRKSMTLSVLREITPYMSDMKYLKTVFKILKDKNIECEFPLEEFKEFYFKLKWFCRVGFVNGCININKNPSL